MWKNKFVKGVVIMSNACHFFPILKWKKGEQCALQHFNSDANFTPVIELVDECDPAMFFSSLAICHKGPVYFDTLRCDDDKRNLLIKFIDYCDSNQINAWPLIYVNDIYNIIDKIAEKTSKFAVKLPIPEDFDGPSNEEVIDKLVVYPDKVIDLFLDAGVILGTRDANSAFANYKSTISTFSKELMQFHQLIICLTSFPEVINIDSGDSDQYTRFDIKIFQQLVSAYTGQDILTKFAYSDYGVTKFTDTELDFRMLRYGILPKVKYTTHDFYFVSKGKKDHASGIFTRSYHDIADEIIKAPFYFGKDFSFGDAAIFDKATNPSSTPGNATNWVEYCANHHIAVLIEQLSNLLDA